MVAQSKPANPENAARVQLDELPSGAAVEVETANHTYRVENAGEGNALISGHPKYCPKKVLVEYHGATDGYSMLKLWAVQRGLRMEFRHPQYSSGMREERGMMCRKKFGDEFSISFEFRFCRNRIGKSRLDTRITPTCEPRTSVALF